MIKFDAGALRTTILNMDRAGAAEKKAARAAAEAAGRVLLWLIATNASMTDHTLEDLRKLGHPYARRIGGIAIHKTGSTKFITTPTHRVHKQSGEFLKSLRMQSDARGVKVMADADIAPHAPYVIMGTRVMLGRDLLWSTAEAEGTRKKMMQAIVRVLGAELRTKAGLRFGGASRPQLPGGGTEI